MNRLLLLLPALLASTPARAQEKPEETREVRIFLLDRTTPERAVQDSAAVLTLERKAGRAETYLFARAAKGATPGDGTASPGLIRSLVSTPYFVELDLGNAAPAPRKEEIEPAEGKDKAAAPLSAQEVLRRARKGTWFARKLPLSALSAPFTATVTIRLGNLTFTSEEFQGPRAGDERTEEIAARVGRTLEALRERSKDEVVFMDLRPVVVELLRDLSKLAPAGFEDGSGAVEKDRQWCLAMARAIEDACYQGDAARIQELSLQCEPRLKEMKSQLARIKGKEPPTDPENPPTVK